MLQKSQKQLKLTILILLIVAIIAGGTIWFVSSREKGYGDKEQQVQQDFSAKRLIVTVEGEIGDTYNAKSASKSYSGKYVLTYDTIEETENAYRLFKENSKVQNIEIDKNAKIQDTVNPLSIKFDIAGTEIESWGIHTMGLNETQTKIDSNTEKEDVVVAVIDSGFDLSNSTLTEQNLNTRIDSRYINIVTNTKDISDNHKEKNSQTNENVLVGHGTHTGGIILDGTPKNVKILPIKAEDDDGNLGLVYICDGIKYAIDQNVDVINLSLGWEKSASGSSPIETEIGNLIQEAVNKGIVVVAAVGNGDENGTRVNGDNLYPASYTDVIGVGALNSNLITVENNSILLSSYLAAYNSGDSNLAYTSFSNFGQSVDFSAPGQHILSLVPTGAAMEEFPIVSGTSHASPHIAAAVATVKSYDKTFTTAQVYKILQEYSLDLGTQNRDVDYGEGMPCFKNYEECDCNCDNCSKIYCFGCSCTTCKFHEQPVKALSGIEITTAPTKLTYEEGEKFDKTGMVVTANYSDSTSAIVTDYTYTPNGALAKTDTKIVVSYTEGAITKTAEVAITVNERQVIPEKTLSGIKITTAPTKLTYEEGEKFDKTGMVVTANYSDSTSAIVTDYTYTPNGALAKTDTKIVVSYTEGEITKTAEVAITVKEQQIIPEKTLSNIEITTAPTKLTYEEGEKFDKTGMVVTANYSDSSKAPVTNYTYTPNGVLTKTDTKIVVSYTEGEVTKTAEVTITVKEKQVVQEKKVTRIEVTTNPTKTIYTEGEKFDKTGIAVVAVYSDGSRKQIENFNCFPTSALTTNNDQITITYTENGATVTTKIQIEVKAKTNNSGNNHNNNSNNNNNNNGNNNIVKIDQSNQIIITNTVDNTTKGSKIANTGIESIIIPGVIITVIGIGAFIGYKRYNDI